MKLKPKSEQEVAAGGLWTAGTYDFEILEADEQESRAGNDMIKLKVAIYNAEGRRRTVFDYLMDTESMSYKLRHCAAAAGLLADYEQGELHAEELVGRTGACKVSIRKATEEYPAQNQISDYIVPKEGAAPAEKPQRQPAMAGAGGGPSWTAPRPGQDDLNDDIPFSPCWQ